MHEKLAFETLYELIISIFTDFLPMLGKIWGGLPLMAQQSLLSLGLIFAFPIIDKLIDAVFKFCEWWAKRH